MNHENTVKFGNFIGTFVYADKGLSEMYLKPYLWVKVWIDVTKPFRTGVIKNDDGSSSDVCFGY